MVYVYDLTSASLQEMDRSIEHLTRYVDRHGVIMYLGVRPNEMSNIAINETDFEEFVTNHDFVLKVLNLRVCVTDKDLTEAFKELAKELLKVKDHLVKKYEQTIHLHSTPTFEKPKSRGCRCAS